jgi:hypothetical protein
MFSRELLIWCLGCGSAYVLALSLLLDYAERRLRLTEGIPGDLVESGGCTFFGMNFVMEALFYVAIPSTAYAFFYQLLPVSGVRAGLAGALFAFVLGAAPLAMRLSVRLKLPMPYMLFLMVSHLLKLGGSLAIIGYLYSL